MILQRAIIQEIKTEYPYHLDVLRLDLLDTEISGNKWYKLKYNLEEARRLGNTKIVTFGGAYSNHIAAFAAACKKFGFAAVGVIRGEKQNEFNGTLAEAARNGMELHFVSREEYNSKHTGSFRDKLRSIFGEHYLIPEGGNNKEGVKGCAEILNEDYTHDYIFSACGTGATYAGLVTSSNKDQNVIGISVLKGENTIVGDVREMLKEYSPANDVRLSGNEALQKHIVDEHCVTNMYSFKGYASYDPEWYNFKVEFEKQYGIPLDYIYTSKLMYAVFDLMKRKKLKPDAKILVVHSGGLQGNPGFEKRYHLTPSL